MERVKCVCLARGCVGVEGGEVDERIGFGLYQYCGNRGSVGCVWVAVVQVRSG